MAGASDAPRRFNSSARRRQNPMVILVLGDAAVRRSYAATLSESGFVALEVPDPSEATEVVGRFLPEIVVTDLGAPALSLARVLRANPLSESIGLLGLDEALTPEREQLAWTAGFDVALQAPCQPETLLTELLALLATLVANSENLVVQVPAADPLGRV
jgi:DNA-binding response OmpR family regulator